MEIKTGAEILSEYRNQEQNLSTFKALEELIDEELEKAKSFPLDKPVKPATCEHNFQIAKRDYYKPDGGQNAFGKTYDQSRTYSTLFCTKCGETKEIITS